MSGSSKSIREQLYRVPPRHFKSFDSQKGFDFPSHYDEEETESKLSEANDSNNKFFNISLPSPVINIWTSVNSELFSSCLHFCDISSLLLILRVSKHWRSSVLHGDVWHEKHSIEFPPPLSPQSCNSPRSSPSNKNLDNQILSCSAAPYASFIKTVTAMKDEYTFTEVGLSHITGFTSLSSFSFIFSTLLNPRLFRSFLSLPNLTQLRIDERKPGVGEAGIDCISNICSLISFHWYAVRVTNGQLLSISRLKGLEQLTIVCRFSRPSNRHEAQVVEEIDDQIISSLSNLTSIRTLHLEITRTPLNQYAMSTLKLLATLEQVTLSPVDNNHLHYLSYLPYLNYLSLKCIDNVGLTSISQGCSHLQHLNIDFGRIVNAFQPLSLHQSLSNHTLFHLHTLNACFPYLDDAVLSLSHLTLLPSLRRLIISTNWTCKLNEELVGELVHTPRLDVQKKEEEDTKGEIVQCEACLTLHPFASSTTEEEEDDDDTFIESADDPAVSPPAAIPLCRRHFPLLDTFLLPYCSGLTDVGLYYCVSRMPSLVFLDTRGCPLLTDYGKGRVRRRMESRANPSGIIMIETEEDMELLRKEKEKESAYRVQALDERLTVGSRTDRQWKEKETHRTSQEKMIRKKEKEKLKEKEKEISV